MKKLVIKILLIKRKLIRGLKNSNVKSKIKSKEDLIVELLTKDLNPIERIKLKISIDERFKIKCLELSREVNEYNLTLTNYLKCYK